MSPEEPEKPTFVKISDLPRQRSERFVSAYANHTEATPGFLDIRLLFCQIVSDAPMKPFIEQHAGIALSWEHAVRVRDLLGRLIEAYEKEHGPIRSDREITPEQPKSSAVPQS